VKSVYLSCTRLYVFWVEIPLMILLGGAIHYNNITETVFKLYPLIVVMSLGIIFVPVFFFRFVKVSYDEIRYIGLFSSRDQAVINEGKTLKLRLMKAGEVRIYLLGNDDDTTGLDWLHDDEKPSEITLFRGHCYGGKSAIGSVLLYYGVEKEDFREIYKGDFEKSYENVTVKSYFSEEKLEIDIRIDVTI